MSQIFGRGAQAVARGTARCLSQVLDRGAQAAARGAGRFASQVPDLGAQAAARWGCPLFRRERAKFLSLFRWERGEISRKFRGNFEISLTFR